MPLAVCVDIELVLLGEPRGQIEGLDPVELDLFASVRRVDKAQSHAEALGLLQPIGDLHGLHVRGLALHLGADPFHLCGGQRCAGEVPDEGVPVRRRNEHLPGVLLGQQLARPLASSPRRGRGRARILGLVGLRGRLVLLPQRHCQRPVSDLEIGLATRRHHDLRRAEKEVHAKRDLCLHHRVQFPRLAAGILAIWREGDLLHHLLADAGRELQRPHVALGLLNAPPLDDELHGVLLVVGLSEASDALRLALFGVSAHAVRAPARANGVELDEELHVVVWRREALRRFDREQRRRTRWHFEPELYAQVTEVVELDPPHARRLEHDVAKQDGVLGQFDLRRVAGARDVEQVQVLTEPRVRQKRQLERGDVVGGREAKVHGDLLLRPQADWQRGRPGHTALGELAIGIC
mmetsp:Transcript_16732/g.42552  ORF Transcript_16732/g.42552 Transcript_16732/m.42552 type:complete len:407 (-) Transcript_16732:1586-2806(-)